MTHKEEWEKELELILGFAPEGSLKHERYEQIRAVFIKERAKDLSSLLSLIEGRKIDILKQEYEHWAQDKAWAEGRDIGFNDALADLSSQIKQLFT